MVVIAVVGADDMHTTAVSLRMTPREAAAFAASIVVAALSANEHTSTG
jgi:hypothetical protein